MEASGPSKRRGAMGRDTGDGVVAAPPVQDVQLGDFPDELDGHLAWLRLE